MPTSRMGRVLFSILIGLLIAVIGFNYERRHYRDASSRFYHAAITGHTEEMAAVLDHHLVRLDQPPFGKPRGGYHVIRTLGEEALVGSVFTDDKAETARFLLDRGVSVNTRAENGASMLSTALVYHNLACAKLLLKRGADVHLDDHFGLDTPLMIAASETHYNPETYDVCVYRLLPHTIFFRNPLRPLGRDTIAFSRQHKCANSA